VGAVGGAIADRFDRRRVLLITQTLAMVQAIIYWLAVWFKVIDFWHIVVLSFFLGIVNTINQTARQSLVNSLVPREELLNAIGLQSSVFNLTKILGPSAGGVIIASVGVAGCVFVNAVSFLALIYNLHLRELPAWEGRPVRKSIWRISRKGLFMCGSGVSSASLAISLSWPCSARLTIALFHLRRHFALALRVWSSHVSARRAATVAALFRLREKSRVGIRWICACVLGFAVSLTLFAFSHSFILSLRFFMVGFCQIGERALSNTAIQMTTPPNLLGRVLSLFFMDRGLWSLGSVVIGTSASAIGIDWSFAACSSVCSIAAIGLLWATRISRRHART
jgi:hypothetical protein